MEDHSTNTQQSHDTPLEQSMKSLTINEIQQDPQLLQSLTQHFLSRQPKLPTSDKTVHTLPPLGMPTASLLTEREIEVLRHYDKGLGRREVADAMKLSFNTIANMRHIMLCKCHCANIDELLKLAKQQGVI